MLWLYTLFVGLFVLSPLVTSNCLATPLPAQTILSGCSMSAEGVQRVNLPNGQQVDHVYAVALQALSPTPPCSPSPGGDGLGPVADPHPDARLLPHQEAALRWLLRHREPLGDRGAVWRYPFANSYNDVAVSSPWPSAFAQAYVLKAFNMAYRATRDPVYLDAAREAVAAFAIPVEEGGLASWLPDGSVFFEEVPVEPSPHILNGDMIAVIALLEAGNDLQLPEATRLGQEGVATLQRHLKDFDVGYWSRYDLNPKKTGIEFRIDVRGTADAGPPIAVGRISLVYDASGARTTIDAGTWKAKKGSDHIAGVDWGWFRLAHWSLWRDVRDGRRLHPASTPGASRQNSYVVMDLPRVMDSIGPGVCPYHIEMTYRDQAAGEVRFEIRDINHGQAMNFVPLGSGATRLNGDGRIRTLSDPVCGRDLPWFVGIPYQQYHIKELRRLAELTHDTQFDEVSNRWRHYLDGYTDVPVLPDP